MISPRRTHWNSLCTNKKLIWKSSKEIRWKHVLSQQIVMVIPKEGDSSESSKNFLVVHIWVQVKAPLMNSK